MVARLTSTVLVLRIHVALSVILRVSVGSLLARLICMLVVVGPLAHISSAGTCITDNICCLAEYDIHQPPASIVVWYVLEAENCVGNNILFWQASKSATLCRK